MASKPRHPIEVPSGSIPVKAAVSSLKSANGGSSPVLVRRMTEADHAPWLSMRQALWLGTDATTRAAEDGTLFTEPERFGAIRYEALVAIVEGRCVGFVEVSLRDDVPGVPDQTVGYVEGIFVERTSRGGGIGRTLIGAAEAWTRSAGAAQLVSDVLGDNPDSLAFHRSVGFSVIEETETGPKRRIVLTQRL